MRHIMIPNAAVTMPSSVLVLLELLYVLRVMDVRVELEILMDVEIHEWWPQSKWPQAYPHANP